MEREEVRTVVRASLMVMDRIAKRTRTQADDLLTSLLQANEERLVDALTALLSECEGRAPTEEQVAQALERVGIRV